MTNVQDYELLLRVRADLVAAIAGMDRMGASIGGAKANTDALGESSEAAAARISALVAATGKQAEVQESARSATERAAQATNAAIEQADRQAAVSRRAPSATAGAVASSLPVAADTAAQAARVAAVDAQREALAKLAGQIDPTVAALNKLDAQERTLQSLLKAGAIGTDDYKALKTAIDASRASLTGAAEAMHGLNLNTSAARLELGRMIKDVATGNFGRLEQSAATLASQTGLLSILFNPLAVAIAAVTGSLGGFALAAIQVAEEESKVNKAIELTGNFAGVTTGQIEQMASGLTSAHSSIGDTRTILTTLVATGKLSGTALESVGQAAVDMAALTGQNTEQASKSALQMFDGTAASALKANDQYHFLTTAIYDQIVALEEEGKTQEAIEVAADAFHDAATARIAEETEHTYGLAKAWDSVKRSASNAWEAVKTTASITLGTAGDETRIADLEGRKQTTQEGGFGAIMQGLLGRNFDADNQAELDRLKAQVQQSQQKADTQGFAEGLATAAVKADADLDKLSAGIDKVAAKGQKLKELNKDFEDLYGGGDGDNPKLRNVIRIVGDDGKVSFAGGLYDKLKSDLDKKYDPKARSTAGQEKAAATAQEDLIKALGDEQGALDPVAKIWAKYNDEVTKANDLAAKAKTAKGADVIAIGAERDALVKLYGSARDASLAKLAQTDREAFEKLRDSLKDVNGISLGKVREQIAQLSKELAKGTITPDEYQSTLEDALNQNFKKLPDTKGVDATVGGPFGELDKLAEQQKQLEAAYRADLDLLNQQHDEKLRSDASFIAKENALYQEHNAKLQQIEQDRTKVTLLGLTGMFSSAAEAVKNGFGEQSEAYRAAFALSKAAAIAQATVNMYLDISQASAKGFPANIPLIAQAVAEGISLLGSIRSVTASFSTGGYTGDVGVGEPAGIVHGREHVTRAAVVAEPGARSFLDDFNRRGMAALADWHLPGYAAGGYVDPGGAPMASTEGFTPTPEPRVSPAAPRNNTASRPTVSLRVVNQLDPQVVLEQMATPAGEVLVMNILSRNQTRVRQLVK